jgi:glycosyltransferase involved in cell wall biosynthesis
MTPMRTRVCVVGSGTRFLSGISYYTLRLTNALAENHETSAILMRRLLPARLYPGRERVGRIVPSTNYAASVRVYNGVDWYWLPSMAHAIIFFIRRRPQFVVFQWWTGTVLHSYLLLALVARATGARVIIEFHEVLDTGELRIKAAALYVRTVSPALVALSDAAVVHSAFDRGALADRYRFGDRPVVVIPHGPYDHHSGEPGESATARERADGTPYNFLFFGVIRPFKGVEDLLRAYDSLEPEEAEHYRLTIVGETWEGWTIPSELIAASRYRDRITFVNRYVRDDEVATFFREADAVVLPYHRSSASGPLHIAMSHGKPVAVTAVGGLAEAARDYAGAIFIEPADPASIRAAFPRLADMSASTFADVHSWTRSVDRFDALFAQLASRATDEQPGGVRS